MRYFISSALLLMFVVSPHCQTAPQSCAKAPTYDNGINLTIHVLTTEKLGDHDIEQVLARDISRFKDTNEIKTGNDTRTDKTGFDAQIFWSEVKLDDGSTVGYVASFAVTEDCALFDNGTDLSGFSSHVLLLGGPFHSSSKDHQLDRIEKGLYDAIMARVRRRRSK